MGRPSSEAALDKAPDAFRIISEVAEDLDVPQHVLRFWETRFSQIKPMKRGGGRRYYRPDDVNLLRGIRHLLYSEGYTIRGVQRILREEGVAFVQAVWREGAPQPRHGRDGDAAEPAHRLIDLLPGFRKAEPAGGDEAEEIETEAEQAEAEETEDEEDAVEAAEASNGRREPVFAAPAPQPRPPGLTRDQLLQLQMALDGLGECRRLLDAALKGE